MTWATKVKKLVSDLATFASVIDANKKAQGMILDQDFYVYYPVQFLKDKSTIQALISTN